MKAVGKAAVALLCGMCVNRVSWRGARTEVVDTPGPWTCAACKGTFTARTAHAVRALPPAVV